MTELHILRVFTDEAGGHGNPLGVFLDGAAVPIRDRQRVAADLGFSETVFVEDPTSGRMRIFTPAAELPFAGHPVVGAAWLLRHEGHPIDVVRPPAGPIPTWTEDEVTWVAARPEWSPQRDVRELASADDVEALDPSDVDGFDRYAWAWIDEGAGEVRARYFAPELGVPEDEATGSAAVVLGGRLGRRFTIRQGRGSVLHVRPHRDGRVAVGGRVAHDEVRRHRAS